MQSAIALNVQQSIRPGECFDSFYSGKENSHKQCHATVEDNRFFQSLQSLTSGGSSTVTFNPNEGLGEVLLTIQLPYSNTAGVQGLGLPAGWGYQLIRRIGYRYGSSQLYYITGAQNLVQTLSLCEDTGKRDQVYALGGQALLQDSDWANAAKRTAYVYLRLPHSSPALAGGALPFPSDVLTAPVQLQIDLQDFASVITQTPGATGVLPAALLSGSVNFTQVTMQDAGDLVARRFDMSKHALTIPLPEGWTQEAVSFPFTSGAGDGSFSLSLTGCKAGDLKKLRVWFLDPAAVTVGGLVNPNNFVAPTSLRFAINGLIYQDSAFGSYLLTQLIRRRTAPTVSGTVLALGAGPGYIVASTAASWSWAEIDLAQPHTLGDTGESALVHGVPVMNSVLSLTGTMPTAAYSYVCFVEYVLNCSWMASRGSAEFIF
jgi:hypothetical protein